MCLTKIFGPVGEGFGWDVVSEAWQPVGNETIHWCRIKFWHTDRNNTFDSYGQTRAAYTTAGGKALVDEDAPKKSLTDAVIKAASHVGIAANIFLGRWDDQKYVDQLQEEFDQKDKPTPNEIIRDGMLVDIKNAGAEVVASHPKFIEDIAKLRIDAPELAAQVDAEIETKRAAA